MATVGSRQLFVFPASDASAREHVRVSVANPVDPAICEAHLDAETRSRVGAQNSEGQIYAWGATPGPGNTRTWTALRPGDYVLVYQNGEYTYVSRVIDKERNPRFAEALWGRNEKGETWELVYFLEQPRPIRIGAYNLGPDLPTQYFGLMRIGDDKISQIVSRYGSLDAFMQRLFPIEETGYLLIRSNVGSNWQDEEGRSYHYGRTVPNYRSVRPGTQFLIDRRFPDGKRRIIAQGRFGDVSELTDGTLRGQFSFYEPLGSPQEIRPEHDALLQTLPGYNVQHSIRVLTREVFEQLMDEGGAPPVATEIDRIQQRLREQGFFFPDDLVKNYLLALRTKPFVLLTGVSGGGKTALTYLIADALGEEHRVVAVKPNWTDGTYLLGFYNPIARGYESTDTLGFIREAISEDQVRANNAKRYHLILDEMNLARVEYYFADLLSAMERPDRRVDLHDVDEDIGVPRSIQIPPNLIVVGTVNIDETVQPFSDKVKDRANTITVPIDMAGYAAFLREGEPPEPTRIKQKAFAFAKTSDGGRAIDILLGIHGALAAQQVHFGYRVMDEILAYLAENEDRKFLTFEEALDFQVDQKVLTKVRGRGSAFERLVSCADGQCGTCLSCQSRAARLPRSAARADRMAAILRETGYTSHDAANQ